MASSIAAVPPTSLKNLESLDDEKSFSEQFRKLFIGGLPYTTTDEMLKEYCSKFGEITECVVIHDKSGRSRGFGFVIFKDRSMVDYFMEQRPHILDGRRVESKRAMPRDEASKPEGQLAVKRIFIGGIKENITENSLRSYFQKFGNIIECNMIKDKDDKLRGFAFITFDDYDNVDRCILEKPHIINEKELHVRKAFPREQISRVHTSTHNNKMSSELYYPPNLSVNNLTLSPPSYACIHPFNYLSQATPLVNTMNSFLPSTTFFSSGLINNAFYPPLLTGTNDYLQSRCDSTKKIDNERTFRSNSINNEQHRKLFLGGLSVKTTDKTLRDYVEKFGEISDCLVMKDKRGYSKCFGFVTFIDSKIVDDFMKQRPHIIDGHQIDPKRAMPREEAHNNDIHLKVRKIFIGGIRHRTDEDTLKNYFEKYGNINGCLLLQNKDGKSRGFAFIEFDDYDSVDKVILARPHTIDDHFVDVKKAIPKGQRQFQTQQQNHLLRTQATTAAYYYSTNSPCHILNNPMIISLIAQNGPCIDNSFSHIRPSNSSHILDPLRYHTTYNNHQHSSCNSQ